MPLFDGEGTLYWNLNGGGVARQGGARFSAAFVYPISRGYFGIGFPTRFGAGQAHIQSDMIMAIIDDSANPATVSVTDRWSTQNALPGLDTAQGGQDNILVPQGIVTPDNKLFVKFQRLLSTGDALDVVIDINAYQPCTFAFSPEPGTLNHGRFNRETRLCNFGNVTQPTSAPRPARSASLNVAHAVLGAFGIGLFITFGGYFYRYLWCLPVSSRVAISSGLFLLGGVLVIISFIIACVMVSQSTADHFSFSTASQGAHGIISLVTMIAVVSFLILRFLLDCAWRKSRVEISADPKSEKAQFYRLGNFASWSVLVIAVLVGWPAIFLGFVDNQTTYPWLWVIGAILIFVGVLFILTEILRCFLAPKIHRDDEDEAIEMSKRNHELMRQEQQQQHTSLPPQ